MFFPSKVFSTSTVARKKTTAVATLRSVATEPVELRPQPTLLGVERRRRRYKPHHIHLEGRFREVAVCVVNRLHGLPARVHSYQYTV